MRRHSCESDVPCCFHALLQEYGKGRAWLPGLQSTPGLQGLLDTADATDAAGSVPGGSSSDNGSGSAQQEAAGPTLAQYLQFGRMMGESPDQVQQRLEAGGAPVVIDDESQQYLEVTAALSPPLLLVGLPETSPSGSSPITQCS
jgi:hypothetical protein